MEGPRIYNLFPLLAGTVKDWETHLPRIAGMGFNWVFLNPFHYPGFSGSLYAVKDYYRLNPLFAEEHEGTQDELLRRFVQRAESLGLSVMMDLVINHTARDSVLVHEHPEWFAREADGSIRSPSAVDPVDPTNVTVWGDLAEIEYANPQDREGLAGYWKDLVRYYTGLGFRGFRCDAAYKVPDWVWVGVTAAAKDVNPEAQFFAETLGCRLDEVWQLRGAGFDYLFNSAKWWDFREGWLLEQYEVFRHIAPSVSFPESHDTDRVAAQGGERGSRLKYLFAAFFSAGVMMPVGYEYGFRRSLNVVETRPGDWEEHQFDISSYIGAVNRMKARLPVLNEEGPQARVSPDWSTVVALVRRSDKERGVAVALINPDPVSGYDYPVDVLRDVAGPGNLEDVTPAAEPVNLSGGGSIRLNPQEMRVFYSRL